MMDDRERTADLVWRHIEGLLDEAGRRELEGLLERSPEARGEYVREMKLHAALLVNLKGVGKAEAPAGAEQRRRRFFALPGRRGPSTPWLVGAAAAACLLAVLAIYRPGRTGPPPAPVAREDAPADPRETDPFQSPLRPTPPGEEEKPLSPRETPPPLPAAKPEPPAAEENPLPPMETPPPSPARPEPSPPGRPALPGPPSVPPSAERPPPAAETAAAVARLEHVAGEVFAGGASRRMRLEEERDLLEGQDLLTGREGSSAVMRFPDGTRIEVGPSSAVRPEGPGRLYLEFGTVTAEVTRRPAGSPVSFGTPHAEATVLGTRLTIRVTRDATRLEVAEGKVRLTRRLDGRSVDVPAGHYAVAAAGVELAARLLPIEEIVLRPLDGKIFGTEWKVVNDLEASTGLALEAERTAYRTRPLGPQPSIRGRADFVLFRFAAEADKEYHIWIRGKCTAAGERSKRDEVAIIPIGARLSRRCPYLGGDDAFTFLGYGRDPGYIWIGGDRSIRHDGDAVPVSVRFLQPGIQNLRLYAIECPMRVDAVWLSSTQKTRPGPGEHGPGR